MLVFHRILKYQGEKFVEVKIVNQSFRLMGEPYMNHFQVLNVKMGEILYMEHEKYSESIVIFSVLPLISETWSKYIGFCLLILDE